jgi:hypothetical protein
LIHVTAKGVSMDTHCERLLQQIAFGYVLTPSGGMRIPLGALIGFGVGVWLFAKFGLVAQGAAFATAPSSEPASASSPAVTVAPATGRISRPFAVVVLAIVGGLARYELIRSLCLSEIKHAHTDDGVRQEMAWAQCDQRHGLFAAPARPC